MTAGDIDRIKLNHMRELSLYREGLLTSPILRYLFLELTLRCNERCIHCGSSCGETGLPGSPVLEQANAVRDACGVDCSMNGKGMGSIETAVPAELTTKQYRQILDEIAADFDVRQLQLCITGGEPLLRRDFFEIMGYAHDLHYSWGMTSNATLIDRDTARRLHETGMKTISVSIDGLRETHDAFRRTPGAYNKAMQGIDNLLNEGGFEHVQVTTVINHQNMQELDALYDIFLGMDIDSWRVIGVEPIGRALEHPEILLDDADWKRLFDFIREKRQEDMPVTYGCSHYLGLDYEREVREHYYLCTAGIYTASIMSNGDIGACLDIERRPETIQGNILRDRFKDVWEQKFGIFREERAELNARCRDCEVKEFCHGDAAHSWNFDRQEPRVCFRDQFRMAANTDNS